MWCAGSNGGRDDGWLPMAALMLAVCLGLAVAHWLMSPLTAALTPLAELQPLPLALLLVLVWLLAGSPGQKT